MKTLTPDQKIEALQNAMTSYKFPVKYFVHHTAPLFCIASKSELGGINTHTRFMTYEEFNAYLQGYNAAKTLKF